MTGSTLVILGRGFIGSLGGGAACTIPGSELFHDPRVDTDAGGVRTEINLPSWMVEVPAQRATTIGDPDVAEERLVLERRENRAGADRLGQVVLAAQPVVERDAQHRIADRLDALDPAIHSIVPPS